MVACSKAEDAFGRCRAGDDRDSVSHCRQQPVRGIFVQLDGRHTVCSLCHDNADRRQLHQRLLRLREGNRRHGDASRSAKGLRPGMGEHRQDETRHRAHHLHSLSGGSALSHLRRPGDDTDRHRLRGVLFSLHDESFVYGSRRCPRAGVLRHSARMHDLLYPVSHADVDRRRRLGGLWHGDRRPAAGEQLPRPRHRQRRRQAHHRGEAWRDHGPQALSRHRMDGIRHGAAVLG